MRVVEFLFNEQSYKIEKFVMVIGLLLITMLLIPLGFPFIVKVIYVPFLTILFIVSVLKLVWYNKKSDRKTRVIDRIEPIFIALVIFACVYIV